MCYQQLNRKVFNCLQDYVTIMEPPIFLCDILLVFRFGRVFLYTAVNYCFWFLAVSQFSQDDPGIFNLQDFYRLLSCLMPNHAAISKH